MRATSVTLAAAGTRLVVRMRDDRATDGPEHHVGIGEITPGPCRVDAAVARLIAREFLVPGVPAVDWDEPAALRRAWSSLDGHHAVVAGFDVAAWNLFAARTGRNLSGALLAASSIRPPGGRGPTGPDPGPPERGIVPIAPTVDALVADVHRTRTAAVRGQQDGVVLMIAPGHDVEPVRAVRDAFPDLAVHVDAAGRYVPDRETDRAMRALDGLGVASIGQPFGPRDFRSSAALQSSIAAPVALGLSLRYPEDVETMLALDAGRVAHLSVSRLGGLTPALAVHDTCAGLGVPTMVGDAREGLIGLATSRALAGLSRGTGVLVAGSDQSVSRISTSRDEGSSG